ncbi:hypothetical protein [Leifsonia sp. LS-T14]|uniref:hypothetical protein n=1 Tax=unclassified Leifsonia TaxID=2663824 RepID=UPI0035A58255
MVSESGCDLVYHYTSIEGFKGILQCNFIRATDYRYLNDASELRLGAAALGAALRTAASQVRPLPREPEDLANYDDPDYRREILENAAAAVDVRSSPQAGPYIACFSEDGDLLGQWRGYKASYSIGFDRKELESLAALPTDNYAGHQPARLHFAKVRYGEEWIPEMVERTVGTVAPPPIPGMARGRQFEGLAVAIAGLASIKHRGFADEREWRAIASGGLAPSHSGTFSRGSEVVPYAKLQFESPDIADGTASGNTSALTRVLKRVIVKPGDVQEQERLLAEARSVLQGLSLNDVEVTTSCIPFRE